MKRGRKKGSGLLAKPELAEWTDFRNRIIYGSTEWRVMKLRQLIEKEIEQATESLAPDERKKFKLPDNCLEAPAAIPQTKVTLQDGDRLWNKLRAKRKGRPPTREEWLTARDELWREKTGEPYRPFGQSDVIDWLWHELKAQCERAVIDGDAAWFERQAKAIREGKHPWRSQFNAKVVHLLEISQWFTNAKQTYQQRESEVDYKLLEQRRAEQAALIKEQIIDRERKPKRLAKGAEQDRQQRKHTASLQQQTELLEDDLTLTPAGKFTDAMASDIYDALDKHDKDGALWVEGWIFESEKSVMDAIRDLADRVKFTLKKQRRKR